MDDFTYSTININEMHIEEKTKFIHFIITKKESYPLVDFMDPALKIDKIAPLIEEIYKISKTLDMYIKSNTPSLLELDKKDNLLNIITETLKNAEFHGNKLKPGSFTSLKYNFFENTDSYKMDLKIIDQGQGFDSSKLTDAYEQAILLGYDTDYQGFNNFRTTSPNFSCGLGIFFMLKYCNGMEDKVEWNEKGNEITIEKTFFKK